MSRITPSPEQQQVFDWVENGTGNAIVNAPAGSGKTTTVLEAISRMLGRVWFGVFSADMGAEIKEKISSNYPELLARGKEVRSSTFHSLGYSILNSVVKGVDIIKEERRGDKVRGILEVLRDETDEIAGVNLAKWNDYDWKKITPAIVSIVSMAKNRGFVKKGLAGDVAHLLTDMDDFSEWESMVDTYLTLNLPETYDLKEIIRIAYIVLNRNNKEITYIDFDDMIYLPIALNLPVPEWAMVDWCLVDEAQDTNPSRRALAHKIMLPKARFMAIGDNNQAIFGFTGADNDSLELIRESLNAIEMELKITYRCKGEIAKFASQWKPGLKAFFEGGEVREIKWTDLIKELKELNRADYGDNAILCRNNKPLVDLCFRLIREGIPAKIEGRAIGDGLLALATRWKSVKSLGQLKDKLEDFRSREVKKAMDKNLPDKADRVEDQVDTLQLIIDRSIEKGFDRVEELRTIITDMFADKTSKKGDLLTLCSSHRSKGLEWNNVFLLGRHQFMPSKYAEQDWQLQQEENLIYVSATRALECFTDVTEVPEDSSKAKEEEKKESETAKADNENREPEYIPTGDDITEIKKSLIVAIAALNDVADRLNNLEVSKDPQYIKNLDDDFKKEISKEVKELSIKVSEAVAA